MIANVAVNITLMLLACGALFAVAILAGKGTSLLGRLLGKAATPRTPSLKKGPAPKDRPHQDTPTTRSDSF